MKKLRVLVIILVVMVLSGTTVLPYAAAGNIITIDFHVAGLTYSFFYDEFTMVDTQRHGWTIVGLLKAAQLEDDWLDVTYKNTENGTYVTEINGLREGANGAGSRWCYRVNGKESRLGMDDYLIEDGDEVVVYFADPDGKGIQYPEIEITDGAPGASYDYFVTFTSLDTAYDGDKNAVVTRNPIIGADVKWEGSNYRTDGEGRVYIPGNSGPAGYHSVRIERYDEQTGIPTVLRLPPAYMAYIPFIDVPADAWYSRAVQEVLFSGHMKGVGDNKFAPEKPMTMAELLVVLWRLSGEGYVPEPDVLWYEPALEWAAETGVLFDTRYSINSNVTREIFIYMFYKAMTQVNPETAAFRADITGASDYVNIAADFREAVSWAVAMGIIRGTSGSGLVIEPDSEINRATVCQMIYNFFEYYENLY